MQMSSKLGNLEAELDSHISKEKFQKQTWEEKSKRLEKELKQKSDELLNVNSKLINATYSFTAYISSNDVLYFVFHHDALCITYFSKIDLSKLSQKCTYVRKFFSKIDSILTKQTNFCCNFFAIHHFPNKITLYIAFRQTSLTF